MEKRTVEAVEFETERYRDFPREPTRALMKDGVWMVAVKDRPKGWEKMGGLEPKVKLPNALIEIAPETAVSVVVRTAATESRKSVERAIAVTAEVEVPVRVEAANRFADRATDEELSKRLVDTALRAWGSPHDPYEYSEWEDLLDQVSGLSEELQARREAHVYALALVDGLEVASSGITGRCTEVDLAAIFDSLLRVSAEKRMREFELVRWANHLRKRGDPCGADRVERLLTEEDRRKMALANKEKSK